MRNFIWCKTALIVLVTKGLIVQFAWAQQKNNLSLTGIATARSNQQNFDHAKASDGETSPESLWKNVVDEITSIFISN